MPPVYSRGRLVSKDIKAISTVINNWSVGKSKQVLKDQGNCLYAESQRIWEISKWQ